MFKPLPPLGYVKARFDYNPETGVLSFKEKTDAAITLREKLGFAEGHGAQRAY